MIIVKENKLEAAGVQFSLPDGFCFDMKCEEDRVFGGLYFISPEGDCSICILENHAEYNSAMDSLMDIFDIYDDIDMFSENETGYIWSAKPETIKINGLTCACAKYEACGKQYYELHFERLNGNGSQLEVLLDMKKEYGDVQTHKNIQEFYKSFQPVKGVQNFEN